MSVQIAPDLDSPSVGLQLKRDLVDSNIYYLPRVLCIDGKYYDLQIKVLEGKVLDSAFFLERKSYLAMVYLFKNFRETIEELDSLQGGLSIRKEVFFSIQIMNPFEIHQITDDEDFLEQFKEIVLDPLFGHFASKQPSRLPEKAAVIYEIITGHKPPS